MDRIFVAGCIANDLDTISMTATAYNLSATNETMAMGLTMTQISKIWREISIVAMPTTSIYGGC